MNRAADILKIYALAIVILVGCRNVEQVENPDWASAKDSELAEERLDCLPEAFMKGEDIASDYTYKLWYGEWIVEKEVSRNYSSDYQGISDVIGKKYSFSEEKARVYYCEKEMEIESPGYDIIIMPLNEETYIPYMKPTLTELGVTGAYVVIFSPRECNMYFLIKDDETLIMYYEDTYWELQRLEHEEGHESFYRIADEGSDKKEINSVPDTAEMESLLHNEVLSVSENEYFMNFGAYKTKYLSNLSFELTGINEQGTDVYYPVKLVIKTYSNIIQEINFDKDDFAPCTLDDFGFEFGDFGFDGYGGFKILETSMGKNPFSNFWIWNNDERVFKRCPDMDMVGYISFDYENKEINVSNTSSASYHEWDTYQYIDGKLTLTKKIVDADNDGYRKVYELLNGRLELIEVSESQLKG